LRLSVDSLLLALNILPLTLLHLLLAH
jgi:hypothetical protein